MRPEKKDPRKRPPKLQFIVNGESEYPAWVRSWKDNETLFIYAQDGYVELEKDGEVIGEWLLPDTPRELVHILHTYGHHDLGNGLSMWTPGATWVCSPPNSTRDYQ